MSAVYERMFVTGKTWRMRRWFWTGLAIAGAAVLAGACSEQQTTVQDAQLTGTNDLIQASVNGGNLLFIIASDRDELKVLDLTVEPTKDFVRAPNPLEPLTIPVLPRPIELARDIRYENDAEVTGPYVYVRGEGSGDISVIGADPSLLLVLKQIQVGAPVASFAARGVANGKSQLFVATVAGQLLRFDLAGPDELRGLARVDPTAVLPVSLTPGESIVSLLILPDARTVAVATRGSSGTTGRSFVYDTESQSELYPLNFPFPVRKLITHPAFTAGADSVVPPAGTRVAAGTRIFGILDEGSCGSQNPTNTACRGLVSVDNTSTNAASATVHFLDALLTDVTFVPDATLALTDSQQLAIPLMGVATVASSYRSASSLVVGPLHFFRADTMSIIDTLPTTAPSVDVRYRVVTTDVPSQIPDGGTAPDGGALPSYGPIQVVPAPNGAVEELVTVTYAEAISGATEVEFPPGFPPNPQAFPLPADVVGRVESGDTLVINDANGQPLCGKEYRVQTVAGTTATTDVAVDCQGGRSFTISAGTDSADPYVVRGARTGFMGRTQLGKSFEYVPAPSGSPPQLAFTMLDVAPPGLIRGSQFTLNISDNFVPYSVTLAPNQSTGLAVPTTVVYGVGLSTPTVFVAYPAAAAVVEVLVPRLFPNITVTDTRNIPTFR